MNPHDPKDRCKRTAGRRLSEQRRGVLVVLFALLLVVVLAMIALGVDAGYVMVKRTEIQRSVDAAVLAAADALRQASNREDVEAAARSLLLANGIEEPMLDEASLQIDLGTWNRDSRTFQVTSLEEANAVRVSMTMNRGPLFFGRLFGPSTFSVKGEAIAVSRSGGPPRDIMLVIDCSGSMDNDGGAPPQPMAGVKDAAIVLCDAVQVKDRVGLTVYSWKDPALFSRKTGRLEVGLTDNLQAVKDRISVLTAGFYTGGTNIAGGIRVGGRTLRDTARSDVEKVLVVLTDGRANRVEPPYGVPAEDLPNGDPLADPDGDADQSTIGWAQEVAGYGITIHTVSLGEEADHELMAHVGQVGAGDHYEVTGEVEHYVQALRDAFKRIGQGEGGRAILVD